MKSRYPSRHIKGTTTEALWIVLRASNFQRCHEHSIVTIVVLGCACFHGRYIGVFIWMPRTDATFCSLKQVLIEAPFLALLGISKTFIVETDANTIGVGAVLM